MITIEKYDIYEPIEIEVKKKSTQLLELKRAALMKIFDHYYQRIDYDNDYSKDLDHYSQGEFFDDLKKELGSSLNQSSISDMINTNQWDKILELVDRMINQLHNKYLNLDVVNLIILATDVEKPKDFEVFNTEVIQVLNKTMKDIKVYYEIGKKIKALENAKKIQNYLKTVLEVTNRFKLSDCNPLMYSEVRKKDDEDGTMFELKI